MDMLDKVRGPEIVAELTHRERVVLANLSAESTLEEIACRLFVSRNTVKSQVGSVYRKLGVSTRAEAVSLARSAGINASSFRGQ